MDCWQFLASYVIRIIVSPSISLRIIMIKMSDIDVLHRLSWLIVSFIIQVPLLKSSSGSSFVVAMVTTSTQWRCFSIPAVVWGCGIRLGRIRTLLLFPEVVQGSCGNWSLLFHVFFVFFCFYIYICIFIYIYNLIYIYIYIYLYIYLYI